MEPILARGKGHGVELQLARWEGAGRPVVCIHGLTANCRCWDPVASGLAPTRPVIAYDLRGRGWSDKPNRGYSIEHHISDLLSLLDHLRLPIIDLAGHSLGASIALAFAARHPDRVGKLILVDGAGKLTKTETTSVFAGIKPSLARLGRVYPSFDDYLAPMRQAPFFQPWHDALTAYFRYEVEETPEGVRSRTRAAAVTEEIMNLTKFNPGNYYGRLRCPTLVLRAPAGMLAQNDVLLPKTALKKMIAAIPEAWLVEIAGANHYSIMFGPGAVRDRAIRLFLDS